MVFDEPRQAYLDTSTRGIDVPTAQFQALVDDTDATKSGDDYTVDCDAAGRPDLVFAIGGKPSR
ncbi:hypothetical protein AAVH_43099, partial [Aphelenchoides avenae]